MLRHSFLARRGDAIVLLALPLLHFLVYGRSFPEHDTYYVFQSFKTVFEALSSGGGFPQWLPKIQYGSPSLVYIFPTLTPAQYAVAYAGAALGVQDALSAFHFSAALELLVFLTGARMLGAALLARRVSVVFLLLSIGLTTIYHQQIWYNLRIIALAPLLFYFMLRFSRERRAEMLVAAALTTMLWLVGNIFYFLPIALVLLALSLGAFAWPDARPRPIINWGGLRGLAFWGLTAAAAATAAMLIAVAVHVFDGVTLHSPLREASGKAGVEVFLTYGRNLDLTKFIELFLALPHNPDSLIFVGFVNLTFAAYGAWRGAKEATRPMLIIGGVFAAMSLPGLLPVARLLYAVAPGMEYFRHIGLMMALAKFCLLVVAAVGVDAFLTRAEKTESADIDRRFVAVAALLIIAAAAAVWTAFGMEYGVYPMAQIFSDYPEAFGSPFQIIALSVLAALLLALAALTPGRGPTAALLLALVGMELTGYFHATYWGTASNNPGGLRDFFMADRPRFISTRTPEPAGRDQELFAFYGPYYPLEAMMRGERCVDVGRRDARAPRVAQLVELRGGAPIRPGEKPEPRSDDAGLMAALGCGAPKLRLTTDVRFAYSDAEEEAFVRGAPEFGRVPLLACPPQQASFCRDRRPNAAVETAPEVEKFETDFVRIKVSAAAGDGAWLVYADAWSPGWRATLDGRPLQIWRANMAFKAALIPHGDHVVEFRYDGGRRMFAGYHGLMLMALAAAGAGLIAVARPADERLS